MDQLDQLIFELEKPPILQSEPQPPRQAKPLTKYEALSLCFTMRVKLDEMGKALGHVKDRNLFELKEIQVKPGNKPIKPDSSEYLQTTLWAIGLVYDQVLTLGEEAGEVEVF